MKCTPITVFIDDRASVGDLSKQRLDEVPWLPKMEKHLGRPKLIEFPENASRASARTGGAFDIAYTTCPVESQAVGIWMIRGKSKVSREESLASTDIRRCLLRLNADRAGFFQLLRSVDIQSIENNQRAREKLRNHIHRLHERIEAPIAYGADQRGLNWLASVHELSKNDLADLLLHFQEIKKTLDPRDPSEEGKPLPDPAESVLFHSVNVFVSYSHDNKFLIRHIKKIEKNILPPFRLIVDKNYLLPGEVVFGFEKLLAESDHILLALDNNYIQSNECMKELILAYEYSFGDPDRLKHRIIPFILKGFAPVNHPSKNVIKSAINLVGRLNAKPPLTPIDPLFNSKHILKIKTAIELRDAVEMVCKINDYRIDHDPIEVADAPEKTISSCAINEFIKVMNNTLKDRLSKKNSISSTDI